MTPFKKTKEEIIFFQKQKERIHFSSRFRIQNIWEFHKLAQHVLLVLQE